MPDEGPVHVSAAIRELLQARGLDRLLAPPTEEERQRQFDWEAPSPGDRQEPKECRDAAERR